MTRALDHRNNLNSQQVEILNESATDFYRMLARAAQNGIFPELVIEIENQLASQTWDSAKEDKKG